MEFGRIWMIEKCLKMHSGIRYEQKSHTILKIINLGAYDFPLWGYNTGIKDTWKGKNSFSLYVGPKK